MKHLAVTLCFTFLVLTFSLTSHAFSISGRVFYDVNGNGQRNVGDGGIPNVKVILNPGAIVFSTGSDGTYSFSGLSSGTYTVKETDPTGFESITPNKITISIKNKNVTNQDFGDKALVKKSESFNTSAETVDNGGGESGSESYNSNSSISQSTPIGKGESESFINKAGFQSQ